MEDFMQYKFLCVGLLAAAAAGTGAAVAADLPVRTGAGVAPVAAAPAFVNDWTGFYVGIHGGGAWARTSFENNEPFDKYDTPFQIPGSSPNGGVFGFQAGYNWQWGPVVGGLEVDYSWTDLKDTTTFTFEDHSWTDTFTREHKIDALGSARFRLGYLIFPNWLLYGTAGLGWGHSQLTVNEFDWSGKLEETNKSFANEFGWVAGVGVEYKIWEHWLVRAEWLHYDFGNITQAIQTGPGEDNFNVRTRVDVARAAISYKF
jgi:outer membrane immunogenic protein